MICNYVVVSESWILTSFDGAALIGCPDGLADLNGLSMLYIGGKPLAARVPWLGER